MDDEAFIICKRDQPAIVKTRSFRYITNSGRLVIWQMRSLILAISYVILIM